MFLKATLSLVPFGGLGSIENLGRIVKTLIAPISHVWNDQDPHPYIQPSPGRLPSTFSQSGSCDLGARLLTARSRLLSGRNCRLQEAWDAGEALL